MTSTARNALPFLVFWIEKMNKNKSIQFKSYKNLNFKIF